MRVLMFGWEFPPHNSGGLGVACEGLAKALTRRQVEIVFVLPKKVDLSDEEINFLYADIGTTKIRTVDTALQPYITAPEYERYRNLVKSNVYSDDLIAETMRYAIAAADIAREESFDIIHAHDWLSFLAGIEAKRVSGKPLVVHVHITSFDQSGGGEVDERVYAIEKAGMETADMVVAVSQYTKDTITRYYGINPDKIQVVHNGVQTDLFHSNDAEEKFLLKKPGQKMVLFVGRLTLHKGPDYFLSAAQCVLKHYPNTLFVIAGSGEMEWQIIRQAAELGIADKVFFAGFARGEELTKLFRAADLYVLPSVSEPFGLTALESLINGTPVLVSKQSGVSEVLRYALKVDFWDVEEMANKIIAALKYAPLSQHLSKHGQEEAYKLTWDKAAAKCIELYRKLIGLLSKA